VEADASLTPRSRTNLCSSERLKRESGTPWLLGSSHAIALTSATCSGGEAARSSRAFPVAQPLDPLLVEPFSPPPDKLGQHLQPLTDLDVAQPFRGVQHELGSQHLTMGTRVTRSAVFQLVALLIAQHDLISAAARHHHENSSRYP
jgi:hypothetical protein